MKKNLLIILMPFSLISMEQAKWDGKNYNNNSKPQYDFAIEYIQNLSIKSDEQILDIGCGSGKVTKELARLAANGFVIGIDKSDSQIETAQKENDADNVIFQTMDAQSLNFIEQFDRIFSSGTFHWIKDHEVVFQGCSQALKKGGVLHILTGSDEIYNLPGILAFNAVLQSAKWNSKVNGAIIQHYLFGLSETDARKFLEKNKFEVKQIDLVQDDLILPGIEAFKAFISVIAKGGYPFLKELSETEQNEFIDDVLKVYIELVPPGQDGSIRYPICNIIILAAKS